MELRKIIGWILIIVGIAVGLFKAVGVGLVLAVIGAVCVNPALIDRITERRKPKKEDNPAPEISKLQDGELVSDRWRIIGCVAIFFGGILLAVWAVSKGFGLPSEAAYQLTLIALKLGLGVTVLGIFFGRRWLTLRTTLVVTTILSVGILLFVLWVRNQSVHAVSKSDTSEKPLATLPTLAHVKAQMKEDNPGMNPQDFKQMRAATGLSHIWELHKDSFKPVSALYLADGTVCYEYSFVANGDRTEEWGVLTTDGLLYANALSTAPWKQFCDGEKGEEMVETAH